MVEKIIVILVTALFWASCDTPPDDIMDGDLTVDTDSETDTVDTALPEEETDPLDEETEEDLECFEAMICLAMSTDASLECLEGLEEEDQEAATNLALCIAMNCADAAEDLGTLTSCLLNDCSDQTVRCIGFSLY